MPAHQPQALSRIFKSFRSRLGTWWGGLWQHRDGTAGATTFVRMPLRAPLSVLVVDDNPVNLMLMSALLQSRGLVPVLAADGAEAVALARETRFDLILMDLQMPVLDGWEATAAIRRFERAGARPAVPVVSYSSMPLEAGIMVRHGFNGSLEKPCNDLELEACLVQWCPSYLPAAVAPAAQGEGSAWPAEGRHAVWGGSSAPRAGA